MAFLSNQRLEEVLPEIILNDKYSKKSLKNASYELRLGNEIYTSSNSKKTVLNSDQPQFELEPGQFALLITDEVIQIPSEFIGFISLKFGFKMRGLINVSGFHVDPGFQGKLKFSVYNAGPNSIILEKEEPYFVLWLSELSTSLNIDQTYDGEHQYQKNITPDDIMKIKGEVASPNFLLNKIKDLERGIDTEREWRQWGLRIIIGIFIAVLLKLAWDWSSYRNGYSDAYKELNTKILQTEALSKKMDSITSQKVNRIFNEKVDSLRNVFENN